MTTCFKFYSPFTNSHHNLRIKKVGDPPPFEGHFKPEYKYKYVAVLSPFKTRQIISVFTGKL